MIDTLEIQATRPRNSWQVAYYILKFGLGVGGFSFKIQHELDLGKPTETSLHALKNIVDKVV